jgi:repressor LexA
MPDIEQDERLDLWDTDEDDKFALRVAGNAMIGEHIQDGDFVVIRKAKSAKSGDIIAIRDDEGEATLRRYFPLPKGGVRLELSPAEGKTSIIRDKVEILGVLVGVVRKY